MSVRTGDVIFVSLATITLALIVAVGLAVLGALLV